MNPRDFPKTMGTLLAEYRLRLRSSDLIGGSRLSRHRRRMP
jgi:hypothetical protein